MVDLIKDIEVNGKEWTDINTAAGMAIGTAMDISNKGRKWVQLWEGENAPELESTSGLIITELPHSTSIGYVMPDGARIWAKTQISDATYTGTIGVSDAGKRYDENYVLPTEPVIVPPPVPEEPEVDPEVDPEEPEEPIIP